jgi:hypothetical protein
MAMVAGFPLVFVLCFLHGVLGFLHGMLVMANILSLGIVHGTPTVGFLLGVLGFLHGMLGFLHGMLVMAIRLSLGIVHGTPTAGCWLGVLDFWHGGASATGVSMALPISLLGFLHDGMDAIGLCSSRLKV